MARTKKDKGASDVFDGFETDITDFTRRKKVGKVSGELEVKGPHTVRLAKGSIPEQEKLNSYQLFCSKTMGPIIAKRGQEIDSSPLEVELVKAHMKIGPRDYTAFHYMTTIIVAVFAAIGTAVLLGGGLTNTESLEGVGITPTMWTGISFLPLLAPLLAYFALGAMPRMTAKARGKDIDKRLSYAMSFVSTMASADVNIDVIFKELGKQALYGEIAKEAQWLTRDIELLGMDTLTAIRTAGNRSPSTKFQDFLQGVVTTTLSGGHLKPYFVMKTEQFSKEHLMAAKGNMETLGMMAESFVVVVVAMPLFLIVMMSLMGMVGGGGGDTIIFLYIIVYGMIPGSQLGFIIMFDSMTEEV